MARIHYERAGSGPTLLLLHGIGSNSRSFRHQVAALADAWTVVAWDAPGYGRSADPPPGRVTIEDYADCAAELLDDLGVEHAAVLGHSFGGVVAQALCYRYPARVSALILADTTTGGGGLVDAERAERINARLEPLARLGPRGMAEQRAPHLVRPGAPRALVAELTEIMAEVRPAGYRAAAVALGNANTRAWLAHIRVPTLVIHGAEDAVVPLETARMLALTLPRARLVVLAEAGHAAPQEQPAAFNAAVRDFLDAEGS